MGFGLSEVNGLSLFPKPPASITVITINPHLHKDSI
jgi:hypothetical protein